MWLLCKDQIAKKVTQSLNISTFITAWDIRYSDMFLKYWIVKTIKNVGSYVELIFNFFLQCVFFFQHLSNHCDVHHMDRCMYGCAHAAACDDWTCKSKITDINLLLDQPPLLWDNCPDCQMGLRSGLCRTNFLYRAAVIGGIIMLKL